MRRWRKRILIGLAILAAVGVWKFVSYQQRYPYGWSHCCDLQLLGALQHYAENHDGWFPRGEATPEASLSLLYGVKNLEVSANLLRGKTVPDEVVRTRLESGELLTPETCGWHYVEGLRKGDDPELALFWDKAGLGHNGERDPHGGHYVGFVSGQVKYVTGDRWEQFLVDQEGMRKAMIGTRVIHVVRRNLIMNW